MLRAVMALQKMEWSWFLLKLDSDFNAFEYGAVKKRALCCKHTYRNHFLALHKKASDAQFILMGNHRMIFVEEKSLQQKNCSPKKPVRDHFLFLTLVHHKAQNSSYEEGNKAITTLQLLCNCNVKTRIIRVQLDPLIFLALTKCEMLRSNVQFLW